MKEDNINTNASDLPGDLEWHCNKCSVDFSTTVDPTKGYTVTCPICNSKDVVTTHVE